MRTALKRYEIKVARGRLITQRDVDNLVRQRYRLLQRPDRDLLPELDHAIATARRMVRSAESLGAWLGAESRPWWARASAALARFVGLCVGTAFRKAFKALLMRLDSRG